MKMVHAPSNPLTSWRLAVRQLCDVVPALGNQKPWSMLESQAIDGRERGVLKKGVQGSFKGDIDTGIGMDMEAESILHWREPSRFCSRCSLHEVILLLAVGSHA